MAFREVRRLEVKEVLRLWPVEVPRKGTAAQFGFDVNAVRCYLALPRPRDGGVALARLVADRVKGSPMVRQS